MADADSTDGPVSADRAATPPSGLAWYLATERVFGISVFGITVPVPPISGSIRRYGGAARRVRQVWFNQHRMSGQVKQRLYIWWHEALRPWWVAVSAAFALVANFDTIVEWVGLSDRFGVPALMPTLVAGAWWALWLLATVIVVLESLYRVTKERDALQAEVERTCRNQVLSDLLSDKHEYGVHELLNIPPKNPAEFEAWLKAEDAWLKSVLSIMREHGCTKQQIRHVHTLGVIPMIPLHPDSRVSQQLSMLTTRLTRIADIARQYGE